MLSYSRVLVFLLGGSPLRKEDDEGASLRRRRSAEALRLSHHLLKDVGMEAYESPADDPRWARRIDLER